MTLHGQVSAQVLGSPAVSTSTRDGGRFVFANFGPISLKLKESTKRGDLDLVRKSILYRVQNAANLAPVRGAGLFLRERVRGRGGAQGFRFSAGAKLDLIQTE